MSGVLAIRRAEENRLPGDCARSRERGLGLISHGLLTLLSLHENRRDEAKHGLGDPVLDDENGEGPFYEPYLHALPGILSYEDTRWYPRKQALAHCAGALRAGNGQKTSAESMHIGKADEDKENRPASVHRAIVEGL
ncbi:hypothetical protein BV20DRAFT_172693 [Pilatotrama ljubarskyi]|nr:hypothetical protein BV20DRAFT_172693 [Pilatotrama ljubarskyi]